MRAKLQEYLLDFVENELSAAEAASVAAEIRGSAALRAELADLETVRAEIKNAEAARIASSAVDFEKLHARIMLQIDPNFEAAVKKK
jgi:hypothetical protein